MDFDNNPASKLEIMTQLLEEDPNASAGFLADAAGATQRYARKVREYYKREKQKRLWDNNGVDTEDEAMTALVFADVHAPYHSQRALDGMLHECRDLNPDVVVINGDFLDCYDVSFWKTDPTRMRFPDEVEEAKKVLKTITNAFPNAAKVYLEGNHELRLVRFLMDKAEKLYGLKVLTVESLLELKPLGWEFISNKERLMRNEAPFSLGNLFVLHGHEMRVTATAVNLPRLYFQKAMVPVMVAHHHTTQEFIAKRIDHKYLNSYSIGCLCDLSVEYCPVNSWNAGYAVVTWDVSGKFSVENRRIEG